MFSPTVFFPVVSRWNDLRTYLFVFLFIAGNLILPQLCHSIPSGGQIFLPIYFFTLIASYKFGVHVGLATAVLSPVLNAVLFGMPPLSVLPVILIKSVLLSLIAAGVSRHYKQVSIFHLVLVVAGYQLLGSGAEWIITGSFSSAAGDFSTGLPGMLIQIVVGWFLLKKMASYEH